MNYIVAERISNLTKFENSVIFFLFILFFNIFLWIQDFINFISNISVNKGILILRKRIEIKKCLNKERNEKVCLFEEIYHIFVKIY